ncbi:MAG: ATP-binding protein [Flavobacteriaceae bacterium]|jgi:hypothetical protein bfra3_07207|nr:ATP-binding protein [Flavobacteriaceae bacterium]DAI14321.1 MAG TPA: ATPase [Caudoviricetes sp.]DAQ02434.1 MAG TPA: ATPase [Caudoviricetes sp.]
MKALSVKQAYSKKFKKFEFEGIWQEVFGNPETTGGWIIHGDEKQGKSTFALMLANYLTKFGKVLYISAEEGISEHFTGAMKRMGINDTNKNFKIIEYEEWEDIEERMKKRQCQKIIFIDNITKYVDEITKAKLKELMMKHQDKLIIFVSHEERGMPDTAAGRYWRKMSKIIVQAKGMRVTVLGRCPGGNIMIDEEKALLYHGTELKETN